SSGSNVITWMQANAPAFPDRAQLASGGVQIQVSYWTHDPVTRQSVPFTCGGGGAPPRAPPPCTGRRPRTPRSHFFPTLGLQPLQVPAFSTTVEFQSAGANPETAISTP